jgi:hypothetical protein
MLLAVLGEGLSHGNGWPYGMFPMHSPIANTSQHVVELCSFQALIEKACSSMGRRSAVSLFLYKFCLTAALSIVSSTNGTCQRSTVD